MLPPFLTVSDLSSRFLPSSCLVRLFACLVTSVYFSNCWYPFPPFPLFFLFFPTKYSLLLFLSPRPSAGCPTTRYSTFSFHRLAGNMRGVKRLSILSHPRTPLHGHYYHHRHLLAAISFLSPWNQGIDPPSLLSGLDCLSLWVCMCACQAECWVSLNAGLYGCLSVFSVCLPSNCLPPVQLS